MIILAGDIGGTKSNLGLFERDDQGRPRAVAEATFSTHDFAAPEAMLEQFVRGSGRSFADVAAACLGVAGPVEDGVCVAEWLPWKRVAERDLASATGVRDVWLINDMVATAHGVTVLRDDQVVPLNPDGVRKAGRNVAVIAAGTGLGESALVADRHGRYHAVTCEGGHTDWAPRTEAELGLFNWLAERIHPVNQETVICGRGLVNVYNYLQGQATNRRTDLAPDGDQAADIAKSAEAGSDPTAARAMDLFMAAYGARAGNLAMQFMSTGGVFVAGGIAAKNLRKIQDGTFLSAFLDKGELFHGILTPVPVYVVTEQKTALLGAANYAMQQV